jgi:protein-S-isoprenylcysteine O-methyltransferase
MTRSILLLLVALFPISEVGLAFIRRSRERAPQSLDRGSMRLLWLSILFGMALAIAAEWIPSARVPVSPSAARLVALFLLVGGLAIRWIAILTLGRFFTVDVAIQSDHTVVQSGLYRTMRHPSYTGLLIAFLGLSVLFLNWLSMLALLVPVTLGVLYRVTREERALLDALGPAYADYCARTRRFVPGLF